MKNINFFISLFILIGLIISCGNDNKNKNDKISSFKSACYDEYKQKEIFHRGSDLRDVKIKETSLNRTALIVIYLEKYNKDTIENIIKCYDDYYKNKFPDKSISLSLSFFNKNLSESELGNHFDGETDKYKKYEVAKFFCNYSNGYRDIKIK